MVQGGFVTIKIRKSDLATMVQGGFVMIKIQKATWPLWSKEAFHVGNSEKPFGHFGPRTLFHYKISGRCFITKYQESDLATLT